MRGRKPSAIVAGSSPVTVVPKPPLYMSKDAKAEWRKVAPILVLERKNLTEADLPSLESYCNAVGNMRDGQRNLNINGVVMANGKRNPAYGIVTNAQTIIRLCGGVLGLNPVDRSRPTLRAEGKDDDNPFDI